MLLNKKIIIAIIAIATMFTSNYAKSQEALSLDGAIKIALEQSKQLQSAKYDVMKAEADLDEVFGNALPKVDVSANYTRYLIPMQFFIAGGLFPGTDGGGQFIEASSDNAVDARVDVSQTIFNSAVFRSISASDNYLDAAKANMNVQVDEVVLSVKNTYYQALVQKESYELVKASQENATKNYKDIEALFEEGLIAEYDKIRAEVQVENFKPQLISAENAFMNAKNNLKVLIGLDPDNLIELTDKLDKFESEYNSFDLTDIQNKILIENPQLNTLTIQQEVNKDFISVYESEYLPTVSAFGNYSIQGQSNTFDFPTASTSTVGLRFKMNLFSGLQTNAKVEKAELDLLKTKTQSELLEINLKSQVKNLVNKIESAQKQVDANEKNIAQAERGYEIAKIRYEEGIGSLLEINDSDLALRTAKTNNLRIVYELLFSYAQLDQLLGNYSNIYKVK
jgi:outer membrane protein